MTEATTGQGVPVAQLPQRLGWRWIRRKRLEKIPDQPIVHLLREKNPGALVDQLSDHLGAVVPHVVLDVGAGPAETQRQKSVQIRKLLDRAALGLRDADSWPRIGRLRFRRYALLSWLLKKNLPQTNLARAPHSDVRHLLREYLSSRRPRRTQQEEQLESQGWELAAQNLPWYLHLLSLMFFPVYYAWWMRAGRVARWFMRQPYLSPGESADFPSFAQRLIATPSRFENAEQVRKLLVHAFLADLTDSYKRRLWRWKWVPKDCYPVLLLRNLRDESTGKLLVRLINDVRNETGSRDPLLVIGAGAAALPEESSSESVTLEQWPEKLQNARRRRSSTAWYVPVQVADEPGSTDDESTLSLGQADLPLKRSRLVRRVPAIALVALLLVGTGAYVKQYVGPCGQLLPWNGLKLWAEGDECVGLSDGTFEFTKQLPPDGDNKTENDFLADFINAQDQIKRQNNEIDFERGKDTRPSATIVYFSTLSAPKLYSSTLNGVREELRGLAMAQRNSAMSGGPLIRIEFANGGDRMKHGSAVAEQIIKFAERKKNSDSPVIGVVGLGGSWTGTREAIKKLGAAGLPMAGTTTSADKFQETSKLYHQVGPDNEQQAQFIKSYLDRFHQNKNLTVYYSGSTDDLYSSNLAEDLTEAYRPGAAARIRFSQEARINCGEQEVVFFTGRADELRNFLEIVRNACKRERATLPHVMAGDDITKFMLRGELKESVTGNLEYTSFYGKTTEDAGVELEGRASLAYDAFNVLQRALINVVGASLPPEEERGVPLDGPSVWRGIAEIKAPDKLLFGITGDLNYAEGTGQVPAQKQISIMRTDGKTDPRPVWTCGNGICEP
ncbi:ABC transporter substrate-binding protein [Saccharopolyspora sp. NPDC002376]